ncbi:MAG: hypothetical protein OEQ47_16375 [Acidimicrobiia bacterium]|nr:hypothetical protein [Acidimicrobiia bacterium]
MGDILTADTQEAKAERRVLVIRTSWGFFVNSIVTAGLGVVFARLIEQAGVAIAGLIDGREPVFTAVVTELRAPGSDLVYLGGTIASLVVGALLLSMYPNALDRSVGKLQMLWVILFTLRNGLFDLAATAYVEDSPVAMALSTFEAPAGLDTVLSVTGAVGLVLLSVAAAPAFLGFSRHRSEILTGPERIRYVATLGLMPGLVGPLLAVVYFIPDRGTGFTATLPFLGVFLVITAIAARWTREVAEPKLVQERSLSIALVLVALIVFALLRFVIEPGVAIPPWDDNLVWQPRA